VTGKKTAPTVMAGAAVPKPYVATNGLQGSIATAVRLLSADGHAPLATPRNQLSKAGTTHVRLPCDAMRAGDQNAYLDEVCASSAELKARVLIRPT
jgi:hypothetical protein